MHNISLYQSLQVILEITVPFFFSIFLDEFIQKPIKNQDLIQNL